MMRNDHAHQSRGGSSSKPKIRLTKLFIDNKWVDPVDGGEFETINPATGEVLAKVAAADKADVDKAVKAARKALESGPWSTMDAADRGRLLFKLADLVDRKGRRAGRARVAQLRQDDHRLEGRHGRRRQHAALLCGLGRQGRGPHRARSRQLPFLHAAPAGRRGRPDHPLELPAADARVEMGTGPGLRQHGRDEAGRADSADGPLHGRAGARSGLSRRRASTSSNGLGETTGAAIVTHPDIDKIAFTGHVDTAKIIQKAAADTLKRTSFELGGKSPNVVFADADMNAAVEGAFHAIYFHGGQCCTAGSRLFVENKIHDEFVERLAEKAKGRKVGDPLDPKTQQGPQVSEEQLDKIMHYVRLGEKQGATLLTGGERVGSKGFFVQPTIFDNVKDEMAIAKRRDLRAGRQRASVQGRR